MKLRKISLFLILFWLILAGLIVWFKVVPGGHKTYFLSYPVKNNFFGGKNFIGNLTPADRVKIEPGKRASIFGDPVYFSVFTPRTFNEAKITITYQDNLTTSTPLIEAGVLVDNVIWRYRLLPLENKLLETGFKNWHQVRSGNILLLQKENNFSKVADFLEALKNKPQTICQNQDLKNCLALYNTSNLATYFPKDFYVETAKTFSTINLPLQGASQFYFTSAGAKDLIFDFEFSDLNLNKQSDPVTISLYQDNEKICSTKIDDNYAGDGLAKVRTFPVSFSCKTAEVKNVLYKLELKMSEDVVLKKISKAPAALNVLGRLHPVSVSNLPLSLWTDSSFIKVSTNNPASRQLIKFGDKDFYLNEPYNQVEFSTGDKRLKEIVIKKDDIILETGGTFSFTPDSFFNPEFNKVNEHFVVDRELKYVLAEYVSPLKIGQNLKQAVITLNTKEAYRENGKYSFMISVPGLSLAKQGSLEISDIKIEFFGRTVFDKIKERF